MRMRLKQSFPIEVAKISVLTELTCGQLHYQVKSVCRPSQILHLTRLSMQIMHSWELDQYNVMT